MATMDTITNNKTGMRKIKHLKSDKSSKVQRAAMGSVEIQKKIWES